MTVRRRRGAAAVLLAGLLAGVGGCSTPAASPPPAARTATPGPPDPSPAPASPAPATPAPPSPAPPAVALPQVVEHGSRDRPEVALTFDSNLTAYMERELDRHQVASFDNTAAIDELVALHVPATFFLAGLWMERYPAETRRLAAVPFFELGSHSYAHLGFTPHCYGLGRLAPQDMADDVRRSEQVLRTFTPTPTRWFRFPGGCLDATALREVAPTGVQVVQYDVAGGDAFGTSVQAIVHQTLTTTRNGSIVVLHITGGNTAPLTARALPAIVDGLRSRGFELVTLSRLLRAQPVSP